MLELVVVMIIVAILMAIAVSSFGGAKKSSAFKAGSSAAASYAEAVEAYMADNGQVPPAIGSAAWPSGGADLLAGPRDVMLQGPDGRPKPYLAKGVPEAVQNGTVSFGASPASTAQASVAYAVSGSTYTLTVTSTRPGDGAPLKCVVTNGASMPAGARRCG
ncbi:MAG: hypothetical protein JWM98_471 [Thermoleophilia bacterium]|nr:hypothetical protein [Thermoleophilia bacterium]